MCLLLTPLAFFHLKCIQFTLSWTISDRTIPGPIREQLRGLYLWNECQDIVEVASLAVQLSGLARSADKCILYASHCMR